MVARKEKSNISVLVVVYIALLIAILSCISSYLTSGLGIAFVPISAFFSLCSLLFQYYVVAFATFQAGEFFGGKGNYHDNKTAVGYSMIPLAVISTILIPIKLVGMSADLLYSAAGWVCMFYFFVNLKCVHQFSIFQTILTWLVAMFLVWLISAILLLVPLNLILLFTFFYE